MNLNDILSNNFDRNDGLDTAERQFPEKFSLISTRSLFIVQNRSSPFFAAVLRFLYIKCPLRFISLYDYIRTIFIFVRFTKTKLSVYDEGAIENSFACNNQRKYQIRGA